MIDRIDPHQRTLPDRVRLPLAFDAKALATDLARFAEEDWTPHPVRQNYEGSWSAIPLRAPAGETHPLRLIYADPVATEFVDTAWLDRAPYYRRVIERFECPLKNVRLMRLSPGSQIKEHVDPDLDAEAGWTRLHIPIQTDAGVSFLVNRRPVEMAPGSCWYLRLADPHSVVNRGAADRVHLVVDAVVNPWLDKMLRA
jgi:hypothetical protein